MHPKNKKLVLAKQTLRHLTPSELDLAAGGSIAGDPTTATGTGSVCNSYGGCNATALSCKCTFRYPITDLE
jgi:hypothetical protein